MIRSSHPHFLTLLDSARVQARAALAHAAGCRSEDIVVTEVQQVTIAQRLASPDGRHHALLDFAVAGILQEQHGPDCGCAVPPAAQIAPAATPSPQGDGQG